MTSRAQELLREGLALPTEERADMVAELLASLDEPTTMDAAGRRRLGQIVIDLVRIPLDFSKVRAQYDGICW